MKVASPPRRVVVAEVLHDVDLGAEGGRVSRSPRGCSQKAPCCPRSRWNFTRAAATPYRKENSPCVPMWPLRR